MITTFSATVGAKRSADVPPRSDKQRKFARPPNTKKTFIVAKNTNLSAALRQPMPTKLQSEPKDVKNICRGKKTGSSSNEDAIKACRIRECLPPECGIVLLEAMLSAPLCADNGATKSSMSERVFDRLKKMCPGVESVELENPIPSGDVEVRKAVNVNVTLRTAAGVDQLSGTVFDCTR